MEICVTFVEGLYAFKFEGEEFDELERLLRLWGDVLFLNAFLQKTMPIWPIME